jgi:hypothetical protein
LAAFGNQAFDGWLFFLVEHVDALLQMKIVLHYSLMV